MKHEPVVGAGREPPTTADRRKEARVAARGVRARMRPGQRLVVVDVSAGGALVEGGRPLRPGADIEVQLESDARAGMIAAHVTRCTVAAIDGESGVTYRAALAFTEACDWVREILTHEGYGVHGARLLNAAGRAGPGDRLPVKAGVVRDDREQEAK